MRRGLLVVFLVLLVLMLLVGLARLTGDGDRAPVPDRPESVAEAPAAALGPDAMPPGGPPVETAKEPAAPEPASPPITAVKPDRKGAPESASEMPSSLEAAPPAFRPNPRAPPPPKPGSRSIGGSRPPMGPTGLWERFPPEIRRGTATIRVLVLDRDGVPVPGADVWLGPPSVAGNSAVSFGDLRKAGKTDGSGVAFAKDLPHGSAAVAGNVGNLLNGRRGLDAGSAVRTVLLPGKTVEVELRLPIALGDFGTILGVVTGPEDQPLRSVSVMSGFNRVRTDSGGRFEMRFVPAGTATVSVSRSGYRSWSEPVTVKAGGSQELDVHLEFREEGSLTLRGTVVGPDGAAVPAAQVYVIAKSGRGGGTVRSGSTDEHGQFEFRCLPDRLATADVRIQANCRGYRAGNVHLPDGLKRSQLEIRLPVQLTKLKLTVVDSASGTPQTRCRFAAVREGVERPVTSFCSRATDGVYETWLEPGTLTFVVEAPNHETLTAVVEVPLGGGDFAYSARLVAYGEESREVILSVLLTSAITGEPIERANIQIIGPDGTTPLAGLKGERPGGKFTIPIPSGKIQVRVEAVGFEPHTEPLDLPPSPRDAVLELRLTPD